MSWIANRWRAEPEDQAPEGKERKQKGGAARQPEVPESLPDVVPLDKMVERLRANMELLKPPCVVVVSRDGTFSRRFDLDEEATMFISDDDSDHDLYKIHFNARGIPYFPRCNAMPAASGDGL